MNHARNVTTVPQPVEVVEHTFTFTDEEADVLLGRLLKGYENQQDVLGDFYRALRDRNEVDDNAIRAGDIVERTETFSDYPAGTRGRVLEVFAAGDKYSFPFVAVELDTGEKTEWLTDNVRKVK